MALSRTSWIVLIVGALIMALGTVWLDFPYFFILPGLFVAGVAIYMLIYQPRSLLIFISFCTPLSIGLENLDIGGIGAFVPTEPLLLALTFLYILLAIKGFRIPKEVGNHPISNWIKISLFWIAVTALTSSMLVVSLKFLLARLWFILPVFFMASTWYANPTYRKRMLAAYCLGLTIVIIYTVSVHASFGFNEDAAHWSMNPFYKDHTSYGALLAMFFPFVIGEAFSRQKSALIKTGYLALTAIFAIAIILSYTRAAWVSLIAAAAVYVVMQLRISFKALLVVGTPVLVVAVLSWPVLLDRLEKNRQDSSDNLTEHVQSISNVSSDASNLERLNRWNSALRMFEDRPLFGFGPGTYMFQYGTYQSSADRTIISTNLGEGGNAHSEYLGPLSEQGLPGLLITVILVGVILKTAITLYFKLERKEDKRLLMAVLLGLITYFTHGILNNFLDTDKASVPVWAFAAIIVALDLYAPKLTSGK